MSLRIIRCEVRDEHLLGTDTDLGTAGSHDDVLLELRFSPFWAGTAKTVQWRCNDTAPVRRVLTEDLLVPGSDHIYRVPVPPEAKREPGECFVTVRGSISEGTVETRASLTALASFRVLPSVWDVNAGDSQDVSASLGDQLLIEIQRMRDYISDRRRMTPVTLADCAIYAAGHGSPNRLAEMVQEDECPNAPKHSFLAYYDVDGDQWLYRCRHCGKPGSAALLGTYTAYSAALPVREIDDAGGFIWRPTVSDVRKNPSYNAKLHVPVRRVMYIDLSGSLDLPGTYKFGGDPGYDNLDVVSSVYDEHTIQLYFHGYSTRYGYREEDVLRPAALPLLAPVYLTAPAAGSYTLLDGPSLTVTRKSLTNAPYTWSGKYSGHNIYDAVNLQSPAMVDAGWDGYYAFEAYAWYTLPVYRVELESLGPVDTGGGTYGPASRAGALHGLFGYYAGGELVPVDSLIVDEGAGTVLDPVHDMTYSMASWSYDYATRTYHITAETGESITVCFGEETVTIDVDGDSATVYYLMRAGQSA